MAKPIDSPMPSAASKPNPEPKTLLVQLVMPYGGHPAGAAINVSEKEYQRHRKAILADDGNRSHYEYPVMITPEHAREKADRERKAAEAREAQMRAQADALDSPGWAEAERIALEATQSRRLEIRDRIESGKMLPAE